MKKYLLPLGLAALLLSGCAGESTDAATDAKPESQGATTPATPTEVSVDAAGPGTYTFESLDGAVGTLNVPGAAPADLEELRAVAGSEPVTYLTGNLDNREGSESFDVYTISVYDMEGNKYDYQPAQDYIGDITPSSEVVGTDVYNRFVDAYNNATTVFDPMQRGDFVMVGPELPAQIAGVSVSNGIEDFGAQAENPSK